MWGAEQKTENNVGLSKYTYRTWVKQMFSYKSFRRSTFLASDINIHFHWIQWNTIRRNIYFCSGFSKLIPSVPSVISALNRYRLLYLQYVQLVYAGRQSDRQEYLDILAGS
jgi:hypothetical protein